MWRNLFLCGRFAVVCVVFCVMLLFSLLGCLLCYRVYCCGGFSVLFLLHRGVRRVVCGLTQVLCMMSWLFALQGLFYCVSFDVLRVMLHVVIMFVLVFSLGWWGGCFCLDVISWFV